MSDAVQTILDKLHTHTPALVFEDVWDEELNQAIAVSNAPELAQAALYIWNDDMDKAHKIAQDNPGPTGNLLHATLHRREPDSGNSNYWLARVGGHAVQDALKTEYPDWTPKKFVDWCEAARSGSSSKSEEWLLAVQKRELELLVEHCLKNMQ